MRLGKPSPNFLRNVIYNNLGAQRSELLVGPTFGVDNAIYRIGPERVLVATTDPLSYLPSLGPRASAWLSVHLLASDLTTCGFSPQFGLLDFNLPPGLSDYNFARYWDSFSEECRKLGVSIIGGHTGRYPGIDYSIIGGGVAMAIVPRNRYLTSAMANDGDDIILTKGAAIETTAVLTRAFSRTVKKALGRKLFEKAWSYLGKVSTVDEALIASSVGVRGHARRNRRGSDRRNIRVGDSVQTRRDGRFGGDSRQRRDFATMPPVSFGPVGVLERGESNHCIIAF